MPDLVSHVALGYSAKKISPWKRGMMWFILGSCLPDLAARGGRTVLKIWANAAGSDYPMNWMTGVGVFHEPAGYAVLCLWMVYLFPRPERELIFSNLLGGGLFHYFLDIFQYHITPGYMPFAPCSSFTFELGLVGTETSLYLVPLWVSVAGLIWYYRGDPPLSETCETQPTTRHETQ